MADVAMPRLSDSMEEGTILKWLKSDGDEVKRGEELVEIETDKANMTYEADQDGTLAIVAQEGDTLPVGDVIARIGAEAAASSDGGGSDAPQAAQRTDEVTQASGAGREPGRGAEDAAASATAQTEAPSPAAADSGGGETPAPSGEPAHGASNGRVKASPVARRMAREKGLELASLHGTGPGGRIVKADVEAAAAGGGAQAQVAAPEADAAGVAATAAPPAEAAPAPDEAAPPREAAPPAPAEAPAEAGRQVAAPVVSGDGQTGRGETTTEELTRLQQTIARRMAESKATAPDFVITLEVDMGEAVELRKQLKAASGDRPAPSFNDFVVKASALALREFPRANGAYRDGRFELYSRVNVGVAVAGQDALIVPTVFDADIKGLGTIARETRALAERVRAGAITPPELSAGTFSVSNLGMFGIKRFVAVINPPQAAILAVGEMTPRPVVRDGEIVVRPIMELTLSCDHRILYGADAARFLARIREHLEAPLRLAL